MSEPFIGEIKLVGFNFAPRNWALCDGQLLPIAQYTALFSLLGTYYGGDGRTTFGLPDMRGRFPMHQGSGPGLTPHSMGTKSGAESHNLSVAQLPPHGHAGTMSVSTAEGDRENADGSYPARAEEPLRPYGASADATTAAGSVQVGNTGSGQAVTHMPPFTVVNFVIALAGLFPSRS